jgi:hypothetical protein
MAVTHTFVSALPDDAADAAAGLVVSSNWNDGHAIDSIEIAGGTVTASTPLIDATQTWNNGAVTFTASKVNVTDTASASGSLLGDWQVGGTSKASITKEGQVNAVSALVSGGTATANTPVLDLSQTWNNAGAWIVGLRLDITDTASASDSEFMRLSVGGSEKFFVRKNGLMLANYGLFGTTYSGTTINYYTTGLRQSSGGELSWSSDAYHYGTVDVSLFRDAAGTLAQRVGTTAQTLRVYGTYTNDSNYVRASLASSSTAVTLAAETAGTGADNVPVNLTPAGTEGVVIGNFAQFTEMTAPAAGAANTARLFCEDNGGGKTRLMVQFASGAAVQIAIEP